MAMGGGTKRTDGKDSSDILMLILIGEMDVLALNIIHNGVRELLNHS